MSQIVFLDTNVLLDVLLARQPFLQDAQNIWTLAEKGRIQGIVSAVSFVNVYYIVRRLASRVQAERAIRGLQQIFQIAPVDREVIERAISAHWTDFEDAVQHASAVGVKAVCIVTRDASHFTGSAIPAIAPDAFLAGFKFP